MATIAVGTTTSEDYDLIPDTTTDWTWVPASVCPDCDDFIDDAEAYTGYTTVSNGGTANGVKTLDYMGRGTVTGTIIDGVEVAATADAWTTMSIISVTSATGTWEQNYHGVLGLNHAYVNDGDLWVEELFDSDAITKSMFSLYLRPESSDKDSYMEVGDYDKEMNKNP